MISYFIEVALIVLSGAISSTVPPRKPGEKWWNWREFLAQSIFVLATMSLMKSLGHDFGFPSFFKRPLTTGPFYFLIIMLAALLELVVKFLIVYARRKRLGNS